MLTSKQRAHLRSIAQSYNTIFFVGKLGIGDELVKQLDDVLNCRELIKVGVQENCEFTAVKLQTRSRSLQSPRSCR